MKEGKEKYKCFASICKTLGSMNVTSEKGTKVWVYDYIQFRPRLKSDMTKAELKANEKAKYEHGKMLLGLRTKLTAK